MPDNKLYYGDNLDILRDLTYFPNDCVDLIYLDPPFNSNRNYNVLFKDESGKQSDAQITAFEDTWHWGQTAEATYLELVTDAPDRVSETIGAMRKIVGTNEMMAYLVMMAARLVELHRVLKPTGSLYLHCDPTASHYLKLILDSIFGAMNFRSEVIWQRTGAKSLATRRLPNNHDVILCYQKSEQATWNTRAIFEPYDANELDEKTRNKYRYRDPDGRIYRLDNLINPNRNRPNLTYEFLGITKVWRWTKERMQEAYDEGLIVQTRPGAVPQFKRYLDEQRGKPLDNVWTDIAPLNSQARERLDYPTQKPMALLERIIEMSTNPGDVVLDPFCGCGTAIAAAQKLGRHWVGIDITHLSIALQKYRLKDMFDLEPKRDYTVIGEPEDLSGARQLANDDRHQFQWWALSLVPGAKPFGGQAGSKQGKKGSDKGIDGVIDFTVYDRESGKVDKHERAIVQVKSGKPKPAEVRDLIGTVTNGGYAFGVFVTLEEPTADMKTAALGAGYYEPKQWGSDIPRVQIITVQELLSGGQIKMPLQTRIGKRSLRVKEPFDQPLRLFDDDELDT